MTEAAAGDNQEVWLTADDDVALFQVDLPLQSTLQAILQAAGGLEDKHCLELGAFNAMFSFQLRAAGGRWDSWALDGASAARIAEGVEQPVAVLAEVEAWKDKHEGVYDLIVIPIDRVLAYLNTDWVERCHGLLKPEGRLIMAAAREKPVSLLRPLLKSRRAGGHQIPVYNEKRLFATLKCGFDVVDLHTQSRFFVMGLTLMLERYLAGATADVETRYRKRLQWSKWLFGLAYQLDALLFATKGHQMVVEAVQHAWRPRHAPVLKDGRSISEAVLQPIRK